jgi:hypothetical protein
MLQVMWVLGFIASRLQICFDERRIAVFEVVSNERCISAQMSNEVFMHKIRVAFTFVTALKCWELFCIAVLNVACHR